MLLPLDSIEQNSYCGGVLILVSNACLFDEIHCDDVAISSLAETVAVSYCGLLIVSCYCYLIASDLTRYSI